MKTTGIGDRLKRLREARGVDKVKVTVFGASNNGWHPVREFVETFPRGHRTSTRKIRPGVDTPLNAPESAQADDRDMA